MIILASKSPRRNELLKTIVANFTTITSDIDEKLYVSNDAKETVLNIAYQKGFDIHQKHSEDIVISADTVVVINNQIIGKPKNEDDAIDILKILSDKSHFVYTAYCIFTPTKIIKNIVESEVVFNKLSLDLIKQYVATGSPLDKAGAYGVQDNHLFPIVKRVAGSINNVIGFPVEEIKKDLESLDLI